MSTQPTAPSIHRSPIEIAPETFLIQSTNGEGHAPLFVNVNSMVIRGAEPIIIDTGGRDNRTNWLDDVFSLVEPADVRWITLSHDDADHTGNLDVVLDLCPNATFVSSWFMAERMSVGLVVAPAADAVAGRWRHARHRRPSLGAGPPTPVRQPRHLWRVRPDHRCVLGLRLVRHADVDLRRQRP